MHGIIRTGNPDVCLYGILADALELPYDYRDAYYSKYKLDMRMEEVKHQAQLISGVCLRGRQLGTLHPRQSILVYCVFVIIT